MATGYEDYVTTMTSSPATSLSRARLHLQKLMELQGVRTSDAGVSYDPSTLKDAIDQTRKDILVLEQAANQRGLPFLPALPPSVLMPRRPKSPAAAPDPARPLAKAATTKTLVLKGGERKARSTYADGVLADLRKLAKARRGSYRAALNPRSRVQTVLGGSADSHADQLSRRLMRELARDLDRNANIFTTLHNKFAQFITGRGVRWIPRSSDATWNRAVETWLDTRMRSTEPDVRGLRTGYDLQNQYVRSYGVDGDVLSLLVTDGKLQLFEGDQLDGPLWSTQGATTFGSTGISQTDAGAPVAFHVRPYSDVGWLTDPQELDPAHVTFTAFVLRPSQTRGTPLLSSCLDDFERADSYMESETIAAEISSQIWVTMAYRDDKYPQYPSGAPTSDTQNDQAVRGGLKQDGTVDWQGITSGSALVTPDGMVATPWTPNRPNVNAEPFLIWLARCWCASTGLAYELVFADLRQMSWAVAKSLVDLGNAAVADYQEKKFDAPFRRWALHQIAWGLECGALPAAPADWQRGDLDWPRLTVPDDQKFYAANQLGFQTGQTSRQRVLGNRWHQVIDELAEEYAYAATAAVALNTKFPQFRITPQDLLGGQPAGTAPAPADDATTARGASPATVPNADPGSAP